MGGRSSNSCPTQNERSAHLIVLKRSALDRHERIDRERLRMLRHAVFRPYKAQSAPEGNQTYFATSQISPTRSASDSPKPRMPPEQTLIPASRTLAIVSSRSSYERVVITCTEIGSVNIGADLTNEAIPEGRTRGTYRGCDCKPSDLLRSVSSLMRIARLYPLLTPPSIAAPALERAYQVSCTLPCPYHGPRGPSGGSVQNRACGRQGLSRQHPYRTACFHSPSLSLPLPAPSLHRLDEKPW